jgi:hypothetical protein
VTIETKTDRSTKTTKADWMPWGRRQGERLQWVQPPQTAEENAEEVLYAPVRPVNWPRVFPGI